MAESPAFDFVCDGLEEATSLDRLEARGTVRLALRQVGLKSALITCQEIDVVLRKVLPNELVARGIPESGAVCARIATDLSASDVVLGGDPG